MYGNRILILVPHPDDEVVGACAAIVRARHQGARVFALYLTTGVPAAEVSWPWDRAGHAARVRRRRDEARRAAVLLGVEPAAFLDLPTRRLKDHMAAAAAAVRRAVAACGADTLWVPAWEGGHQDHDSTNFLAATLDGAPPVFEFAEYNFAGAAVRSHAFPAPRGTESELVLSEAETRLKRLALSKYPSERGNLGYVGSGRECFRPLAAYDYGRPPHAGRLFWQRFQWVPFRHPRVDFTRPDEVCTALRRYRSPISSNTDENRVS